MDRINKFYRYCSSNLMPGIPDSANSAWRTNCLALSRNPTHTLRPNDRTYAPFPLFTPSLPSRTCAHSQHTTHNIQHTGRHPVACTIQHTHTQIQFNDSGTLNATAGFTFNKTTNNITIAIFTVLSNFIYKSLGKFAFHISSIGFKFYNH